MTHFSQSVHILSQSIPAPISIDPATVATAIEVSALNDMMIDDPSICTPLLGALSHSWRPEPLSSAHLIEACRNLSQAWVQSPSLFDTAAAILANNASQEQWNCAQRCLSSLKLALACQVVLISDVDFPSGPIRPSSGFNPQPTLTASLVLSPSLAFPPMHYLLSQPFPKISNVVSCGLSNNKYTMCFIPKRQPTRRTLHCPPIPHPRLQDVQLAPLPPTLLCSQPSRHIPLERCGPSICCAKRLLQRQGNDGLSLFVC